MSSAKLCRCSTYSFVQLQNLALSTGCLEERRRNGEDKREKESDNELALD